MSFRKSTPEDVRWTYRLLLGREPQEHDILEKLHQNPFTDDLVKFVLSSDEYKLRVKSYSAAEGGASTAASQDEGAAKNVDGLIHFDDIAAEDETGFVEALYLRILGRESDFGGLNGHVALIKSNAMSRLQLIQAFMASDEFVNSGRRVTIGRIG